jgi:hypothetical protein
MAKMKYYEMDRATIVQVNKNIYAWWAGLHRGQKSVSWSPAQQQELHFLADQIMALISVVNHLNEIVQNDGQ